jgi:hypothetical protein
MKRMEHRVLLQMITREWEQKARIHLESARYWEFTKLSAKNEEEEKRATERYDNEMKQAQEAHNKIIVCLGLKSSL